MEKHFAFINGFLNPDKKLSIKTKCTVDLCD